MKKNVRKDKDMGEDWEKRQHEKECGKRKKKTCKTIGKKKRVILDKIFVTL